MARSSAWSSRSNMRIRARTTAMLTGKLSTLPRCHRHTNFNLQQAILRNVAAKRWHIPPTAQSFTARIDIRRISSDSYDAKPWHRRIPGHHISKWHAQVLAVGWARCTTSKPFIQAETTATVPTTTRVTAAKSTHTRPNTREGASVEQKRDRHSSKCA